MTRHLLKLIWNRKRTNLLVMGEIFFSFLVVFGVSTLGLYYLDNYRAPLGYAYQDVWRIDIDMKTSGPEVKSTAAQDTIRRLLQAVRELPEVAGAAGCFVSPYEDGGWNSGYRVEGRTYRYWLNSVTDEFKDVMGLELLQGRWFSAADDGVDFRPVVINQSFARYAFGGQDPVGRSVPQDKDQDGKPRREMRVLGVIREFRQHGEFSAPEKYLFQRTRLEDANPSLPRQLLIKVQPGTGAVFEERLTRRRIRHRAAETTQ